MSDSDADSKKHDVDLAELLDTLPVLINVISADQRYAYVNRPFEILHSSGREDIVGRKLTDMLGDAYEPIRPQIEQALAGERVRFEVDLDGPDGETHTFRTTYVPRLRPDGSVDGFISHSQNITARKRAEREKRQLEEKLGALQRLEGLATLAGGVAHDFNNLLVSVLANAQLVRETLGDALPCHEEITQIEQAARQASELSRQMLAYAGKGVVREDRVDLSELSREMGGLLQAAVGRGVQLDLDLAEDLPPAHGDRTQLGQILINLLTNASEALGEHGCVRMRTGEVSLSADDLAASYVDDGLESGRYVTVEIEDDGVGMDGETLSRLFDPFYSTKFPGRGLGLAACLGIVRAHRGAIFVRSAPGEGTHFRVCLPACEATAAADTEDESPASRAETGRVLVVDDDPMIRRVATRILEGAGFEVALAEDGQVAIDLIEKDADAFDVVLLDLTMPVMGGVETLTRLREAGFDLPAVICSGYGQDHVQGCFQELAVEAVVEKPFEVDDLVETIRLAMR